MITADARTGKARSVLRNPASLTKLILFCSAVGVLYYGCFIGLIEDWLHLEDFSHGFFVPPIAFYIMWGRLGLLDELEKSPNIWGLPVLVFGLIASVAGRFAAEDFTFRLSFLIVLGGAVLFLLGWPHLRRVFLFPLLFMVFMIPIPSILLERITFPMQIFATKAATSLLHYLNICALREGNIIVLPNSTLEVAGACSGIRSLISLLAFGTVFAYYSKRKLWHRLTLVVSCLPIAVFANAFRVSTTGIIANYYGESTAMKLFHSLSGYFVFLSGLGLLLLLGFCLSKIRY